MIKPITVISDMGTRHQVYHYFYSVKKANNFLEAFPEYGALCVRGKRIYCAELKDRGKKI